MGKGLTAYGFGGTEFDYSNVTLPYSPPIGTVQRNGLLFSVKRAETSFKFRRGDAVGME